MTITAATRRDAITICAITAGNQNACSIFLHAQYEIGASSAAWYLACRAWQCARLSGAVDPRWLCGEAECLLRDGWSP